MENKQAICNLLCLTLQSTRACSNLEKLTYDEQNEIVIVKFEHGTLYVNVALDSGYAMVKDIVNHLGI